MASSAHPVDAAAFAAFSQGDDVAAEQAYDALLLAQPQHAPSVLSGWAVNRASCLLRLGRLEDAEKECHRAREFEPGNAAAKKMLNTIAHLCESPNSSFLPILCEGLQSFSTPAVVSASQPAHWLRNRAHHLLLQRRAADAEPLVRLALRKYPASANDIYDMLISMLEREEVKDDQLWRVHEMMATVLHRMYEDSQRLWCIEEEVLERQHAWAAARGTSAESNLQQDLVSARAMLQQYKTGKARDMLKEGKALVRDPMGNTEQAIKIFEDVLKVFTVSEYPYEWADAKLHLGKALSVLRTGDLKLNKERAIKNFEDSLKVYTPANRRKNWAEVKHQLGLVFYSRVEGTHGDNIEEAIKHHKDALEMHTCIGSPGGRGAALNALGNAYKDRVSGSRPENLETALEYYNKALEIFDTGEGWARVQNNLGNAYHSRLKGERMENLEKAINYFNAALTIRTKRSCPHPWAATQNNLGHAYMDRIAGKHKDNLKEAIEHFKAALEVRTREADKQKWAATTHNLGKAYLQQAECEGQEEHAEVGIKLLEAALEVRTYDNDKHWWAATLGCLGHAYCYLKAGGLKENIERGIKHLTDSLEVHTRGAAPLQWAGKQHSLGNAYANRLEGERNENIEMAIKHYKNSLSVVTREANALDHQSTSTRLAQCLHIAGRYQEAIAAAESALAALDDQRGTAGDNFAAKQHLSKSYIRATTTLLQCLLHINDPASALSRLDAVHALCLAEAAHSPAEDTIPDDAPFHSERVNWNAARRELKRLLLELVIAEKQVERTEDRAGLEDASLLELRLSVQRARADELRLRDILHSADPLFLPAKPVKPLSYAEIKDTLGSSTVAAAWFWLGSDDKKPAAAADEPDACIAGVFLFCSGLVQPKVMLYDKAQRAQISAARSAFSDAQHSKDDGVFAAAMQNLSDALQMRRFHDEFLRRDDPFKKDPPSVPGNSYHAVHYPHLVILPYGLFQPIPFDGLPVTADGVCLSDVYANGTFYAPSLSLLRAASRPGVDLKLDAKSFVAVQNPTCNLPGADEEVQMLVQMLGPGVPRVLLHEAATIAALTTELNARRSDPSLALHFSCHGKFDHRQPWLGGLVMANEETLTVSSVMDQQLRNCHLCVLSACDTGRLDTRDAEAVGLTSAFLVAGVCRIVSSLWHVSDTATALLMARMYEQLIRSGGEVSVTAALRNAQIWLRTLRFDEAQKELGHIDRSLVDRLLVEVRQRQHLEGESEASGLQTKASEVPRPQKLWINTSVSCTAGLADRLGLSGFFQPADDALSRNPGERFTEQNWADFVAAFDDNRVTFVYSHLFPTNNDSDPNTKMPERDYWFRVDPPADTPAPSIWVILHVHFLGTWAECREDLVAQVNARFANTDDVKYQFEGNGAIQAGIMPTAAMFRVTAVRPDPRHRNDVTKWMGGGANQPPPWDWHGDPDRNMAYLPTPPTIVTPDNPNVAQDLLALYTARGTLQRFRDVRRILAFAAAQIDQPFVAPFQFPLSASVGGFNFSQAMDSSGPASKPPPSWRPFASPRYWAAFVVYGDGTRVVQAPVP